ncbi:MAG: class F sortase [Anaerolineae bacterium]|nr:class F sortase [Anaerolineae bacterium]
MHSRALHILFTSLLSLTLLLAGALVHPKAANAEEPMALLIPAIELAAPVVDVYLRDYPNGDRTWDIAHLTDQVGWMENTGTPGQPGKVGLVGHVEIDQQPSIFAELHGVEVGDMIYLIRNNVTYVYRVTVAQTVPPNAVGVLDPDSNGAETLTLITCASYDPLTNTFTQRLIVSAVRVG